MNIKLFFVCSLFFLLSCKKEKKADEVIEPDPVNKILVLQVGYKANDFIGGTELSFARHSSTFNVITKYQPTSDFGSIKIYYKELDELIFDATTTFMGMGKISFPASFLPARHFETEDRHNTPMPVNGFELLLEGSLPSEKVWDAVKQLSLVKRYMKLHPDQKPKVFLYSPAGGIGADRFSQWILILKN